LGDPKDQPEPGGEAVAIGQLGLDVELDGVARNLRKARLTSEPPLIGMLSLRGRTMCHTGLPGAGNGPAVDPRPSPPEPPPDRHSTRLHGR
jgi:hypothetical protein